MTRSWWIIPGPHWLSFHSYLADQLLSVSATSLTAVVVVVVQTIKTQIVTLRSNCWWLDCHVAVNGTTVSELIVISNEDHLMRGVHQPIFTKIVYNDIQIAFRCKGRFPKNKTAVFLDFVQTPPPPIWTTCTTFLTPKFNIWKSV